MVCPKCGEETLNRIKFKHTGKEAYLCRLCATVWSVGEDINMISGHLLQDYILGEAAEFVFEEVGEKEKETLYSNSDMI